MSLADKRVVVGMGGGVAAFKAVELVRELQRRGASVRVVMTERAARFVGPVTLTGLTGQPAVVDLWDPRVAGEIHVELGRWADAMVVAPATMHLLARLALGLADDAVTTTAACIDGPLVLAPAMHARMWSQASTQRNVATLRADGAVVVGPVEGPLASGEIGVGRMAEPSAIADMVTSTFAPRDLEGMTVLVTAGPTVEDLDPVRFLGNRSSGKMGFAIAERARDRGAKVILVTGPVGLPDPPRVEVVRVRSALEMQAAVKKALPGADALVMSAAVADYRPRTYSEEKVKKGDDGVLELVRNPDILLGIGTERSGPIPILVGFALETRDVETYARGKLVRKNVDLVVANEARVGFGGDENEALLVTREATVATGRVTKRVLADRILDHVRKLHTGAKTA